MNKLVITITLLWFTTSGFLSSAQTVNAGLVYTENVEAHINTDFLITGETLYFSIHCLGENIKPSTLSKLAYVELIGENEKPILQTKVSLLDGKGDGDFFLPSTVPSGNYTLIVYTKWMRNFPAEDFFQKQITIINPYLKQETQNNTVKTISASSPSNHKIGKETSQVHLVSDKLKYSTRQKVVVSMKNNDPVHECIISLNVHQYNKNITTYSAVSKPNTFASPNQINVVNYLPDLRGETIGGVARESVSHQPLANANVYLTAVGTSYVFQITKTDSIGRFYFTIKNTQTSNGIQFQVDRPSASTPVEVILDTEFLNDYKKFKPSPLSIDTVVRKQIEQRNVYSQIENAYFAKKRDSILVPGKAPFFGTPDKIYKLDDFTRFPTMEDIFREYMYEVVVTKRAGKFALQLINGNSKNGARFINSPLLLIDGIPIFDTETLMNYNPLLIKTVSLVTRQYFYGGMLYDGILSVNTYTGLAKDLPITSIQKEHTSWQQLKKYYSPIYNNNQSLNRIPDYRVQLFWNPTITIKPGQEITVEFYTSDVEGEFLVEARGFNSNGEVVNIHDRIEVRSNP